MKLKEIKIGETGYTNGYGLDAYPHTVVEIGEPYGKRGRKPLKWVKGSKYIDLRVQNDELVWGKDRPANATMDGPCNADTGANGIHEICWFVPSQTCVPEKVTAVLLPDGEVVCKGLGYRSYNRDSSF